MKVGIVVLAYFIVLVAITVAVAVLSFGGQIASFLQALHRMAP